VNLFDRDDLARMVSGGLRDAICCHGPITHQNLASATKRVAGHVADRLIALGREACADAGLRVLLARTETELKLARKQRNSLRKCRADLLALLRENGIEPAGPAKARIDRAGEEAEC
jgi:hypothetical protein